MLGDRKRFFQAAKIVFIKEKAEKGDKMLVKRLGLLYNIKSIKLVGIVIPCMLVCERNATR